MFIIETNSKAPRKMSILMGIAFAATASFGPLFTMHIYVKPSPPTRRGFRVFGFPRDRLMTNHRQETDGAKIRGPFTREAAESWRKTNSPPPAAVRGEFMKAKAEKPGEGAHNIAMRRKGHRLGVFVTIVAFLVCLFGLGLESGPIIGLGVLGTLFGYLLARLWYWVKSA
jgi:hypothetical protein